MSEQASKASSAEQANEWCERMSERTSEWPSTFVWILDYSGLQCPRNINEKREAFCGHVFLWPPFASAANAKPSHLPTPSPLQHLSVHCSWLLAHRHILSASAFWLLISDFNFFFYLLVSFCHFHLHQYTVVHAALWELPKLGYRKGVPLFNTDREPTQIGVFTCKSRNGWVTLFVGLKSFT